MIPHRRKHTGGRQLNHEPAQHGKLGAHASAWVSSCCRNQQNKLHMENICMKVQRFNVGSSPASNGCLYT
eukprot:2348718-Rhodomonas_salina.3